MVLLIFSVLVSCKPPFTQYSTGCYLSPDPSADVEWLVAEADCQTYGPNVHLVAADTPQVRGLLLHGRKMIKATWGGSVIEITTLFKKAVSLL